MEVWLSREQRYAHSVFNICPNEKICQIGSYFPCGYLDSKSLSGPTLSSLIFIEMKIEFAHQKVYIEENVK